MKIKFEDTFSETGLNSHLSFETLRDTIIAVEQGFDMNTELNYRITGFTITEDGIKIHKEYIS